MNGRKIFFLLLGFSASVLSAGVEGFTRVRESGPITEYRLESNGLTVLLQPEHSLPVVTFMVTYRIGSRNESYGTTGATHLLEHLMFKGTPSHNKETGTGFDQLLEVTGANSNATTWLDRTNYFSTLPPGGLPVIIRIEADRMRNLRLREEDRRTEMTVVRNEFQIAANDPGMALETGIWATAFQAHPYRHSVLGWQCDVENVPIEKLRAFYDSYYWPNNATVSVIGDFETDAALALVKAHYGVIPRSPVPIPEVYTKEPPQTGPRRFVIQSPGELGRITLAYKIPAAGHADCPALAVLCDILGTGTRSRFYKGLTEKELTTDVTAYPEFARDASLLLISAELTPESTHEAAEAALLAELAKVKDTGVTEEELASAINRLVAQLVFTRDGPSAISEALTEFISTGDWTMFHRWDEALRKVTADEVRQVARRWLREDQSSTGWYRPGDSPVPPDGEAPPVPSDEGPAKPSVGGPGLLLGAHPPPPSTQRTAIAPRVTRGNAGGVDLLVCPVGVKDIVSVEGSVSAGDPGQQVLASFLTAMLDMGTTTHDADALTALLDESGATMEFILEEARVGFSARCRKKDLPGIISLLAEQLRTPAFPEEKVEIIREQLVAAAMAARADTNQQASIALSRVIFPPGHPLRQASTEETMADLEKITRKDLVEFHQKWLGSAGMILAIAGDVDPASCRNAAETAFQGWSGGASPPPPPPPAAALTQGMEQWVPIGGKENINVCIGQPTGLKVSDPDALALSVATAAFGQGFTSRLVNSVRDTEGLTYGISASLSVHVHCDGVWEITANFAPEKLARGLAAIRKELEKWHDEGLTAAELEHHQRAMAGRHLVNLSSSANMAATLHQVARWGLPLEWIDTYPEQISSLTLEQVNGALRRCLDPGKMVLIKSGTMRE